MYFVRSNSDLCSVRWWLLKVAFSVVGTNTALIPTFTVLLYCLILVTHGISTLLSSCSLLLNNPSITIKSLYTAEWCLTYHTNTLYLDAHLTQSIIIVKQSAIMLHFQLLYNLITQRNRYQKHSFNNYSPYRKYWQKSPCTHVNQYLTLCCDGTFEELVNSFISCKSVYLQPPSWWDSVNCMIHHRYKYQKQSNIAKN